MKDNSKRLNFIQTGIMRAALSAKGKEIIVATSKYSPTHCCYDAHGSAASCRGLVSRGLATDFSIWRGYTLKITSKGIDLMNEFYPSEGGAS